MKDSGCLARAALRTDLHLACVQGPDVGVVVAPGTVGRAGDMPLSCASVARTHAVFTTREGRAFLDARPDSPPFRLRTRARWWRSARTARGLTAGARLRLGDDVFEVRARPMRLAWPGVERRGRGSLSGSSLLRGAPWFPSSSCLVSWGGDCVRPRALHGCGSVSPRWWRPSPASPRSFSAGVRVGGAGKAGTVPRLPWCSLGYRNQDPHRGSCGRACGRDGPRAPVNACSSRRRRMNRGAPRSVSRDSTQPSVPCGARGR